MTSSTVDYDEYIRSRAWFVKRCQVIAREYGKCQRCRRYLPNNLEIHHLRYDKLGGEPLDHLEAVCRDCHPTADAERRERDRWRKHGRRVTAFARWKYGEDEWDWPAWDVLEAAYDDFVSYQRRQRGEDA